MIRQNKKDWTAEEILRDRELCLDEISTQRLLQAKRIVQYRSFNYEPDNPGDGIPLFEYILPNGTVWREVFCGRGLCLTAEEITESQRGEISEALAYAGKETNPTP